MRTTTTTGVVAATALAVSGLTLAPAPAVVPDGITVTGPTYPEPQAGDATGSPFVSEVCGLTVAFADPTPGARYGASIALASTPGTEVEVDSSIGWDQEGIGEATFDCGYIGEDHLVDGETYVVTVQEGGPGGDRGQVTVVYDEVDAPLDLWLSAGGERLVDTVPTGVPVDFVREGAWEEGATVTTRVSMVRREVVEDDWQVDGDPFVDVLSQTTTSGAVPRFSLPHYFDGDYVFVSVRADKPGRAPVVVTFEDPFEVVASPGTTVVPAGWVPAPGTKAGTPYLGETVGVSAPTITPSGKRAEVATSYQWFLDGKKIPGATKRTYAPPVQTLGGRLTLGIQFTAPGYLPRNGSFNFGTVLQRAVPAAWVRSPAVRSGAPRVGRVSSVSGPTLTPSAVSAGTRVYFQWYVDGRKVPGATSRSYKPPASTRGATLTLAIAISKPAWKPLQQTVSFGRIG